MAVGNRTEVKAAVTAAIVPAVSNADHIALLNNEINESAVFRKDIIDSETESGGAVTIDYSDKDTATVTTAVNLAVSFTNLENGDVKYLSITKGATNTISFAGATDVTHRKSFINSIATLVVYQVSNNNGNIYVDSININNDISGNLLTKGINIGDWDMDADAGASVAHGLTLANIRRISVMIRNDTGGTDLQYPLDWANTSGVVQGSVLLGTVNVVLSRLASGTFDTTAFNATSYNRGWITIDYIP